MRAIVCRKHGNYRDMAVEEVPSPELPEAGIRVAVKASGIGFATLLVIEGKHQNTPALPLIPGTEVAGVVTEVAAGVERVKPGDRVAASVRAAGFAEEVVVDVDNVYPIPDAMDFIAATQFPTIYATGHGALAWRAGLKAGETLLVLGAAGGSGLAAVEIGKALGANVIAVAGGAAKLAAAADHGADFLIDHLQSDIRDSVLEVTGGRGVDVVYDPVGGAAFEQSMRVTAPGGRILVIGFASGDVPTIPANILLVKSISVIGLNWGHYLGWGRRPRTDADIAQVHRATEELFDWYSAGKLRPLTHATFAFDDFADAIDIVAQRRVIGKVVLVP
jgi:NADPH2:quinone reductase